METRQKIQEIDTKIPELREKNVVNPISKVNVFFAGYKCNSIIYSVFRCLNMLVVKEICPAVSTFNP